MTERHAAGADASRFVVLGMGNPLLSDDGAGIHALAAMERCPSLPPGVRLVDGGTTGPALLGALAGCDGLLVLDAVDAGGEAGDVVRVDLHGGLQGMQPGRTAHDTALASLLADLRLLDALPRRAVLFGIQPASLNVGMQLSAPVRHGLDIAVRAALEELNGWTKK